MTNATLRRIDSVGNRKWFLCMLIAMVSDHIEEHSNVVTMQTTDRRNRTIFKRLRNHLIEVVGQPVAVDIIKRPIERFETIEIISLETVKAKERQIITFTSVVRIC